MSDEKAPAKIASIRVGSEVFTDVRDYLLVFRSEDGGLNTRLSNHQWAYGALISTLAVMDHTNEEVAGHDCEDGECDGHDENGQDKP